MKRLLVASTTVAILALWGGPAFAQTAVGVGTGVAKSSSNSASGAVAIGGGNASARGGTGIGTGGNPAATVNIAGQPSATTATINNQGTSTVRNVPTAYAPSLAAAGLETCLGSVSGGGSFVGTGFSFGSTIPDPGCAARLDARTLWSFGLKKAALVRLCLTPEIYRSMPEVCTAYGPRDPRQAYASADAGYTGGQIELIDGKTGAPRMCDDYNVSKRRCRVWAH